jgi:protein-tyrosine phosphatase
MKIFTTTLTIISLFAILSCSITKKESEEFNRSIPLTGQPNFRDLGDYQTSNGTKLKTGLIYRSGTLAKLTDDDVEKINDLNIKTVVNFLDEGERLKYGEDKLPEGIKNIFLPIAGQNNEAAAILKARQTGDFSNVPVDFNYKIHALLTEDGKEAYAQLFHLMADPDNYPIVFHCSHGVHRTGTAAALILSVLDVPWETVKQDYLLSNECRKEETKKRIKVLNSLAEKSDNIDLVTNAANIEAFYVLKGEYIDGTKTAIEEKYNSFNNYLNSLGITEKEKNQIKAILIGN